MSESSESSQARIASTGRLLFDPSSELRAGLAPFFENPEHIVLRSYGKVALDRYTDGIYANPELAQQVEQFSLVDQPILSRRHLAFRPSIETSQPNPATERLHFKLRPTDDELAHILPAFVSKKLLPTGKFEYTIDIYADVSLAFTKHIDSKTRRRAVGLLRDVIYPINDKDERRTAPQVKTVYVDNTRLMLQPEIIDDPVADDNTPLEAQAS